MTATIICPLFHGAKNVFVPRHFILRKLEDLPRQARDTHTGKVEGKRDAFSAGWSMQYGRHNHGAAYTNDPWSVKHGSFWSH
jgi:hypothetical protein